MGWVKLDDHFDENPKLEGISLRAFRAYVFSLTYSARNLTDGYISGRVSIHLVGNYGDRAGVELELVDRGLWDAIPGGFRVHDYLAYNPSKQDVLARREVERERKSRYRSRRDNGDASRRDVTSPDPTPIPKGDRGGLQPVPPAAAPEARGERPSATGWVCARCHKPIEGPAYGLGSSRLCRDCHESEGLEEAKP